MEAGKEKGFVLYDEVNDLLAEDFPSGREFEDLLTDLDSAGVEILEEPKLDFEKSKEEPEDFGDLELTPETGDKTNDPVRMYLREMGTVPLLTREGEIELAKRNERGQWAVRKALSRSALVIREIIQLGEDLQRGVTCVRDVLVLPEFVITDEDFTGQLNDLLAQIGEIEKYLQEEPAVPPEAASRIPPDETQAASRPALRPGAQHGADLPHHPQRRVQHFGAAQPGRPAALFGGRAEAAGAGNRQDPA